MNRIVRLILAAGAAVVLCAVAAGGVQAGPGGTGESGNSAAALACQNDGWQNLVTSTGQSFTNQGECVAYAAGGGTLQPKLTLQGQWERTCVGGGGRVDTSNPSVQWWCIEPDLGLSQATYDALAQICLNADGTPDASSATAPYKSIFCNF
jgi:hypothetical protein